MLTLRDYCLLCAGEIEKEKDPAKKLALQGYELITRFARLLEGEGIPHKYPVPKMKESEFVHNSNPKNR